MVSPDTAVRRLLRDTAKSLQPYGFHGSDAPWTRVEAGGVASVGRTRLSRTWTDGQQTLEFGLCLGATPIAWWEYANWRAARLGLPPTPWEKATGPGLIDADTLSEDLTAPWSLRPDPEQSGSHALRADIDAIRADLPRRVHAYARRALRLLEPERYLDELTARPDPDFRTREAILVLLAAHGPGPRLDDAIERIRVSASESGEADEVIDYARRRAAHDLRREVPLS